MQSEKPSGERTFVVDTCEHYEAIFFEGKKPYLVFFPYLDPVTKHNGEKCGVCGKRLSVREVKVSHAL